MSIGKNAIYFKDYVVAIGHFNQVIDNRSWMAEPFLYRAIAKINLDDYTGAYLDADKALERNPFLDKAYLIKGVSKISMNDTISAINEYQNGLRYYPSDFPLRYNLAAALYMTKKYDEAKNQLDSLKYYNHFNIDIERLYAECALASGDTIKAESINDDLLSKNSGYIPSLFLKYNICNNRGKYEECISLLDEIEKLDANIPELYLNRGFMHYTLNNYKSAMNDYSKAIELSPYNVTALNNRALLRGFVGEYNGSIQDWDKIITIDSLNYIAIYNRALMFTKSGKYDKALDDINIIIKNNPAFIDGFEFRSQLYSMMGKNTLASKDMIHAYNLRTDNRMHNRLVSKSINSHRSINDNDISKYDKLISDNNRIEDDPYINNDNKRGRIQDKNTAIEFIAIFALTDKVENLKNSYFWETLERFNKKSNLKLYIYSSEISNKSSIDANIGNTNYIFEDNQIKDNQYNILQAFYMLKTFDFDKSIDILNDVLADYSDVETRTVALYIRAVAYYYKYLIDIEGNSGKYISAQDERIKNFNIQQSISDLTQIIEIDSNNPYAYYNRALMKFNIGDRESALNDMDKCISINKNIAEAYYNRAIINMSLNNFDKAIIDMSKAGELGIQKAYNAIKRMSKK